VGQYKTACLREDRERIADAIRLRFTERYIKPARGAGGHGFTMMAISCLMIEALESFARGWKTRRFLSRSAFTSFFNSHHQFIVLREHAKEFYEDVRCGNTPSG
jgi:hypothetical protein